MSIEQDFSSHKQVTLLIKEVQDAEREQRNLVQEQKTFILEKDGQWDERTVQMMENESRYRGTFDQVSPILDQISGEMDEANFGIEVSPAGGGATEDVAEVYGGIVRNIENISNTSMLYSEVGKSMIMAGLDGLEVVQEDIDANTFDQDLVFKAVSDWYKSVWFDLAAIKPDMSDSNWAIKLRKMPAANYDKQFPKGSGMSIGEGEVNHSERRKTYDTVTVGKLYYKKPITIPLVKMSDGSVYVKDKKFLATQDELAEQGITIADERERKSWRVWTRVLDGDDWLTDEEETVFSYIPLVPAHGSFAILDGVRKYSGKTLKLMDSQRGLNFAISAEVEDVALAPNDCFWMTKEQAAGNDYSKMNVDKKPVRFYNHQPEQMPPARSGGKMGNPGLQSAAANMQGLLSKTANMDDPSMGQNPGLQSGTAVNALVGQSNNGHVKWFKSMEAFICQAFRVCIDAIPRVYDATRTQRVLGEDGTGKMVELNKKMFDEETNTNYELNDLSKGSYDVTCSMGAAFKNQQEAAVATLLELINVDPRLMQIAPDVIFENLDSPGMGVIKDRYRVIGIQNGTIPRKQYTEEEEKEKQVQEQQAAQQPPQPDPNMLIAQAALGEAEAANKASDNKTMEIQGNHQLKAGELNLEMQRLQLENEKFMLEKQDKNNVEAAKINQGQQKIEQDTQKIELSAQDQAFQQDLSTKELGLKAQGQNHSQSIANQPQINDDES
jgi:hypothetical protein